MSATGGAIRLRSQLTQSCVGSKRCGTCTCVTGNVRCALLFGLGCLACTSDETAKVRTAIDVVTIVCGPELRVGECRELILKAITVVSAQDAGTERKSP